MVKKLTKIVATISDRRCDVEHLKELYEAGINVVRLNTAHQGPDDTFKVVNAVREVSDKIALLVDTKGPEVRTKGHRGTFGDHRRRKDLHHRWSLG
jgi:pyruvate kinase